MKDETTPCPKCSTPSPLVDYAEVDIGVGVQTFNHEYECPTHGCFAFVYDEASHRSKPVFRDEAETKAPTIVIDTTSGKATVTAPLKPRNNL